MQARITVLEKTENSLQESEARLRLFAETSFEGIVFSEASVFIDCNEQFLEMFGYQREDLLGKSLMLLVAPDSQESVREKLREDVVAPYKIFMLKKNGDRVHAEIKARMMMMGSRKLRASTIRDVTEQEAVQTALSLSEKKFSAAFYSSPDSININRLKDGVYLEINQGFTKIMGYTPEDVIGKSSLELDIWWYPEDRARLVEGLRENGEVSNLEAKFRTKEGDYRIGLMSARVISCNKEPCILSVTRDITQRQETQKQIELLNGELLNAYDETLEGWSRALNLRDPNTDAHSRRVVEATIALARKVGIPESELVYLRRGAILHDIGKMGVPDHILLKPGPLTKDELEILQKHPVYAYEMLSTIPFLKNSLDIPHYHHEKWDGTGYPHGLKGLDIPLSARVFSIIDVFDALTSDRIYRPAWKRENALDFIREKSGSFFDPEIVEYFFELEESYL